MVGIGRPPLAPSGAAALVALDSLWGAGEIGATASIVGAVGVPFLSLSVGGLCFALVTFIQRYVENDRWDAALAKGLLCGVLAGVPFPVMGTGFGLAFLAWAGAHELTSGAETPTLPPSSDGYEQRTVRHMAQNPQPNRPLSPYEDPNLNPYYRHTTPPPPPPSSGGFFGCFQNTFAIILLTLIFLIVLGAVVIIFGIRDANNTAENIVDSIAEVFDSEPSVTQVQVRQIILAQNDTRWLESYRETQSIDITAKNDWPGILPGQRSLSYLAFVTVSAGIDLDLIEADDIEVRGTEVNIRIPRPQLRDCILDLEQSRYYERNCSAVGVIDAGCGGLEDLLKNRALQTAATENISRIQEEAYESAAETLQDLVETLSGVERVNISVSETDIPLVSKGGTCAVPLPADNTATVEIQGTPILMTATPQP